MAEFKVYASKVLKFLKFVYGFTFFLIMYSSLKNIVSYYYSDVASFSVLMH
jgi:hypothetical protein